MKNYYFEYRSWHLFWGLFLDTEKEIQKILDEYNQNGYRVVHAQYGIMGNLPLGKIILILLITTITLGFISYWVGVSIIFEREDISSKENNNTASYTKIVQSDKKEIEKTNSADIGSQSNTDIPELRMLIMKEQKSGIFSKSLRAEIIENLKLHCTSKEDSLSLISYYRKMYNSDLISDLKETSSNYDYIKEILRIFIDYNIVDIKYPHDYLRDEI